MTHPTLEQGCTWPNCRCSGVYNCKIGKAPEIKRLNTLITEQTRLNQAEADQLRAQVAALEAEVARLKEPVGLVWVERKIPRGLHFTAGIYDVFAYTNGTSESYFIGDIFWHGEGLRAAKAACAAHHAARYREMQGK